MSTPLLEAQDLRLVTRRGPVLAGLDLVIPRSDLTVVSGPSGSGRSALLLAVCGRLRGVTGNLRLDGSPRPARARDLRARTSLARLGTLVQPEERLTVGESLLERALLDGARPAAALRSLATTEELLGVAFDHRQVVGELDSYRRTLLCVALALVRPADLVVLDDADAELDLTDQRRLFAGLERLATAGPAVLASTTEPAAVPAGATVVVLDPARGPAAGPSA